MEIKTQNRQSNRNFGLFISIILALWGCSLYLKGQGSVALICFGSALAILILSLFKPAFLSRVNIIGTNLLLIIETFFMGVFLHFIFFLLISPTSILMKILKRDKLNLKAGKLSTCWQIKNLEEKSYLDFNKQY